MTLAELRKARGYTQKEVAKLVGCSHTAYSHYEWGVNEPSIETLVRLADLFGVSIDAMVGREEMSSSTLSANEIEMIDAARAADYRARQDALTILQSHRSSPVKKGRLVRSGGGETRPSTPWSNTKGAAFSEFCTLNPIPCKIMHPCNLRK